ncbi:putative sodium/calcium exchanger 7 [Schistocerca gregaria]|uniref:putative sodium/calcium exchanger 7 n=1 Tax=Schistocerca gregaria TaxID=7010 RepID=UPI00211E82DA|nr:putative sodium/calcium exchanger 7 [Schistocerca gregaria]
MLKLGLVSIENSEFNSRMHAIFLILILLVILCAGNVYEASSQKERRCYTSVDYQINNQLNAEEVSLVELVKINSTSYIETSTLHDRNKLAASQQTLMTEKTHAEQKEETSKNDSTRGDLGWIPYFYIYDHLMKSCQWLAVILFILWMAILFSLLMVSTDDFFLPNLIFISDKLGLRPEVAGLTILAFGNGASDFITNSVCILNGSPSIAFGSIIGTGLFITTFVAGCITLAVKKIQIRPVSFFRDILFYLASLSVLFVSILTGKTWIYQPIALLILYITYAVCAISHNFNLTRYFSDTQQPEEAQDVSGMWLLEQAQSVPGTGQLNQMQGVHDIQQCEQSEDEKNEDTLLSTRGVLSNNQLQRRLSSSLTNEEKTSPLLKTSFFDISGVQNLSATFPDVNCLSKSIDFSPIFDRYEPTMYKDIHADKLFESDRYKDDNLSNSESTVLISSNEKKNLLMSLDEGDIDGALNSSNNQQNVDNASQYELHLSLEPETALTRQIDNLSSSDLPRISLYSISAQIEKKKIYHYLSDGLKLSYIFRVFRVVYWIFRLPLYLIITTPKWNQFTAITSVILFWPTFFLAIDELNITFWHIPLFVILMLISCIPALFIYFTSSKCTPPSYQPIFNYVAFITCLVVMYIIGEELIALIKTLGILFKIPEFILGATFVTFGNSIVDIIVNTSLAKEGKSEIAFAAVYGGPMFSLACGFGLILLVVTIQTFPIPYQVNLENSIFLKNIGFLFGNIIITAIFCSALFRFQLTKKMCLFWWSYYFIYLILSIVQRG